MKYPLVSIQIPTYNQSQYLAQAIESCLAQDYPHLEINIADDCSTDDTALIVQLYLNDHRVHYYCNEYNLGMVGNYRKALYTYATGEWAINLDGDDYFVAKNFISKAIALFMANPKRNIILVQGNHNYNKITSLNLKYDPLDQDALCINGKNYFINYYKVLKFTHCATLYKRAEALKLNFYSFNGLATDFNSIAKLFMFGDIVIITDKVAQWRKHDDNASWRIDSKKYENEMFSINEIGEFAKPYFKKNVLQHWVKEMNNYLLATFIDMQFKRRQKWEATRYLLKKFNFNYVFIKQFIKSVIKCIVT